jgi:hypothetical protein
VRSYANDRRETHNFPLHKHNVAAHDMAQ